MTAHSTDSDGGAKSEGIALAAMCAHLDRYLRVAEITDFDRALNGLQVESDGPVRQVAVAVDACLATITAAAEMSADLMIVHHGLFWDGLTPIVGRHGRRVRTLLESGLALYSVHLPLDLHPYVGNNAVLARKIGLSDVVPFGEYEGQLIGSAGHVTIGRDELIGRIRATLGIAPHVIAHGPEQVERVGVLTGNGGRFIRDAHALGLDTLLTGEGGHDTYFDAEEWGMNLIYAGHYATETVGVKALGEHLHEEFGVPWQFIDHPTGL